MNCVPAQRTPDAPQSGFLEAGEGETVLLLHGSAGTGALWRKAIGALQSAYRAASTLPRVCGGQWQPAYRVC
jgi:pimeloyl-ACP methyl ester carboxylesterase